MSTSNAMARVTHSCAVCQKEVQRAIVTPRTPKTAVQVLAQRGEQEQNPGLETTQHVLGNHQYHAINQKQSLALVQIMLHASFGTLFYLREFLPLSCFGERDLFTLSHQTTYPSYEGFIGGSDDPSQDVADIDAQSRMNKRGQPLKILLRNRDEKADAILDLLEQGIFEALSKNVLEAVQLTVFIDRETPSHVLESYTFSFRYSGGIGDVNRRPASISLGTAGCTVDMKTMRTAKLGLEMIIRRLITLSAFLPTLPSKRYMEVHLFYTADCPEEYEPPGFRSSSAGDLVYPHDDRWTKERQFCGSMDTGVHRVGLKVTSLKLSRVDQGELTFTEQIPIDIEYSDVVSRDEDIDIDPVEPIQGSRIDSSQNPTQINQDTLAKRMLQRMVPNQPSSPDSDIIPTQARGYSCEYAGESHTDNDASIHKPQLSQEKLSEIVKWKIKYPSHRNPRNSRNVQPKRSDRVRCQCGWDQEEESMVQCDFCHSWQHMLCYGYLRANDPSLPDTHTCYKCLLYPNEAALLREMGTLVLLRRSLRVIIEEGYPNRVRAFSQKLHCNGQTIVQVTDLLKKQGFLQATPGSKSKGFLERGLPKFSIPDSPLMRERLRNEIFNPLAKISHHYVIPRVSLQSLDSLHVTAAAPQSCATIASQAPDAHVKYCFPLIAASAEGSRIQSLQTQSDTSKSECPESEYNLSNGNSWGNRSDSTNIVHISNGYKRPLEFAQRPYASVLPGTHALVTGPFGVEDTKRAASDVVGNTGRASAKRIQSLRFADNEKLIQRDAGNDVRKEQPRRKRRKLSNATTPIDVCDPMDDDSI